ncbi:hypothetical protein E4T43_07300 [Aureobasidium subglaciale]|nr:hypothetical protein E4T43_07300 [Aureobasidium subglaciale]
MFPDYKKFGVDGEEPNFTHMVLETMYWCGVAAETEKEKRTEGATVAAKDGKNESLSDISEKLKHGSASSKHNTNGMPLAPIQRLGNPNHTHGHERTSFSPSLTTSSALLKQPLTHSAFIQLAPSLVQAMQDLPEFSDCIHVVAPEGLSESESYDVQATTRYEKKIAMMGARIEESTWEKKAMSETISRLKAERHVNRLNLNGDDDAIEISKI